jgi:hypothetical protein
MTLKFKLIPLFLFIALGSFAQKTYRYAVLGDQKNIDINGLRKIAPIHYLTAVDIFGY